MTCSKILFLNNVYIVVSRCQVGEQRMSHCLKHFRPIERMFADTLAQPPYVLLIGCCQLLVAPIASYHIGGYQAGSFLFELCWQFFGEECRCHILHPCFEKRFGVFRKRKLTLVSGELLNKITADAQSVALQGNQPIRRGIADSRTAK